MYFYNIRRTMMMHSHCHQPLVDTQNINYKHNYNMAYGLLRAGCESKQQQRIALCVR
jgi:hypothetical protein